MANLDSYIAVLTGDLIGSTKVPARKTAHAMEILSATAAEIAGWQVGSANTRFTRFRGDGWQIVIKDHWLALRAALVLAARLRANTPTPATRIAIGIGGYDTFGSRNLADANGAAFSYSGMVLDNMPRSHFLSITGPEIIGLHNAVVALLQERITRWTPQQAAAMAHWLRPDNPTQVEIGRSLGISPQAVSYRLVGAGASAARAVLEMWEFEQEYDPVYSLGKPPPGAVI